MSEICVSKLAERLNSESETSGNSGLEIFNSANSELETFDSKNGNRNISFVINILSECFFFSFVNLALEMEIETSENRNRNVTLETETETFAPGLGILKCSGFGYQN
ncbi:hypothetical protein C1645_815716 [Glomus cerebriforme]|uniref:Uncharacterized protein n=1 Tax=Glomus cerebriforme TaxID=658196 RepID=A0A397TID5_9GLOM|nr:hypothetical protein C1645_815716 [Glomus cerebriforme]